MTQAAAKLHRSFILASAWLLAACTTGATLANPPDWVLNPPPDSVKEYWGVGEGYDLETARRSALRSVAAKLRVSVSGTMESQTTVSNGSVDRSAQSRVSEVVQETEFSNVSVEKSARYQDAFYALVKIDRRVFVKETQAKFDSMNRTVQEQLGALDRRTPIEQFRSLTAAAPQIEKAIAYGQLLRVADPGFMEGSSLQQLEAQRQQAASAAKRLVVFVEHAAGDADVARAVTSFLNAQGMRVSPSDKSLVLRVATTSKENLLFGSKSHQLNVALQLVDDKGQTLASKQYRANGNSLDSHELARQDAVTKLLRAMNAAGATAGLGL